MKSNTDIEAQLVLFGSEFSSNVSVTQHHVVLYLQHRLPGQTH